MTLTLTNCLTFTAYWRYPTYRNVACIILGVSQVVIFILNMFPWFTKAENKTFRLGLYVCVIGMTCLFALVWLIFLATGEERSSFLPWVILALAWLAIGGFFYGGGYPEKWFP